MKTRELDFTTASGRANVTAYLSSLEHQQKELDTETKRVKGLCLDYMDAEGIVELSAGGRTWKAVTREQARLALDLVQDLCDDMGVDIAKLKKLVTSHYFQLCK